MNADHPDPAPGTPPTARRASPRRVVVVGQGYVGLPLAMRAVEVGHDVVGFDVDLERVKRLAHGESFVEDVPPEVLCAAIESGRYCATDDLAALGGFDVAVITVPTPLHDGAPDLRHIEAAARMLGPHIRRRSLVILESTTYPGTTEELMVPLLDAGSGLRAGADYHVGYSPERIDPGNRVWTFQRTPKIVAGVDEAALAATEAFYRDLVETTVAVTSTRSAELAKLLENTFRHVNVALVNELAVFAADLGIDVWEAIDAAATKPFGFMRFTPGPGVGGHCLPIDPSYLSWTVRQRLGHTFRFVELANDVNDHMADHVVGRVIRGLNRHGLALSRSRVLVLGLAYKKNSSDARESPAVTIIQQLVAHGAWVQVADPHVPESVHEHLGVEHVRLDADAVGAADAVVVVTDHDRFDWSLLREHPYVFDCRHVVEGSGVEHL